MASPKNVRAFQRALLRWYRHNGRNLPWRQTRDPYAILVSEFMLQQTQVAAVIPYYHAWLRRFPDFVSLAQASENDVLRAWQGLGYYARSRNLHATASTVVDRYRGRFPRSVEQIQHLPGIGKYTAHAVASFAFDQSTPIVEANTARVLTRLFDFRKPIDSSGARETLWRYAAALVPKSSTRVYNSALIDLGALVCIAHQPKCVICPVKKFCSAKNPQLLPVRKSPAPTKRVIEKHAFVLRRGKILLEQSSSRWRGMWILPPLKPGSCKQSTLQHPVYTAIFPFTHHRVTLRVYRLRLCELATHRRRWFPLRSLDSIPIASPHCRALRALTTTVSE